MAAGHLRLSAGQLPLADAALLYEDEALLILDKPAGITTLAERFDPQAGLLYALRQLYPSLRAAHRLDRDTTGVLVFAKGEGAYRAMAAQFEARSVAKTYLALVEGHLPAEQLIIDAPLAKSGKGRAVIDFGAGKPAETAAEHREQFRQHALVAAYPRTGRTHQIRAHLAYVGAPLVGDPAYGGHDLLLSAIKPRFQRKAETPERPLNRRVMLHAAALRFRHPFSEEELTIEAALPADFDPCLKQLRKHGALG